MKRYFLPIAFVLMSCSHKPEISQVEPDVIQQSQRLDSGKTTIEYVLNTECKTMGQLFENSDKTTWTLSLSNDCRASIPSEKIWFNYRRLVEKINQERAIAQITQLELQGLTPFMMSSWGPSLALEAQKSDLWRSYLKTEKAKAVFITLFQHAKLGKEVESLFKDTQIVPLLTSVEKVQQKRAETLPFAKNYGELFASRTMLPYGADKYIFQLNVTEAHTPAKQ